MYKENVKLTAYNGKEIDYMSCMNMKLSHNSEWFDTKFYVIDVPNVDYKVPPVLGLQSCEQTSLVTVHITDSIDLKSETESTKPNVQDTSCVRQSINSIEALSLRPKQPSRKDLCYNYIRFREKAHKCELGCKWSENAKAHSQWQPWQSATTAAVSCILMT